MRFLYGLVILDNMQAMDLRWTAKRQHNQQPYTVEALQEAFLTFAR